MKKHIIHSIFFFILIASLSSCLVEPKFPSAPQISFNKLQYIKGTTDTIYVTINFQDGNGDLGLNDEDLENPKFAPFVYFTNPTTGLRDSSLNENSFNFFIDLLIKSPSGQFEVVELPSLNLNSTFRRLNTDEVAKPLEGEIRWERDVSPGMKAYISNKTIKFKLKIKDRELNVSNEIETDTLKLPKL